MKDLFADPLLFLPVIVILVIFGIAYVAAMIWAYNRDAKKQGKKSGCLPVVLMMMLFITAAAAPLLLNTNHKSPTTMPPATRTSPDRPS